MYFSYLRDEQFRLRKSKWMTIRLILFGGLLHLSFSLVAQVKNIELEKTVVRNIVAYHFRYAQEYEIETESDLLNTDTLLFFPRCGRMTKIF